MLNSIELLLQESENRPKSSNMLAVSHLQPPVSEILTAGSPRQPLVKTPSALDKETMRQGTSTHEYRLSLVHNDYRQRMFNHLEHNITSLL